MRYAVLACLILAGCYSPANAQTCQPGTKSCKIVPISPDEMRSLEAIFDAALFANRMQMEQLTKAWRDKINQSPDGVPFDQKDKK